MGKTPWGLTVRAVIFDGQGRCLLVRRSKQNKSFGGMWEWPGGKVDSGEDFAAALHREVAEETGLAVELAGLACSAGYDLPKIKVALLCLEARLVGSDEVKLSDEHDAFEWVSPIDIPRYEYMPGVTPMMLEYAKKR